MLEVIMCMIRDLIHALRYLPYGILAGGIVWLILKYVKKVRIKNGRKKWILTVFIIYIVIVLYLTILSREAGSRDAVMLNIFQTVSKSPQSIAYVLENILLFIPYGFLLPMLWKCFKKAGNILLMGFFSSLCIEGIQWITETGFFQTDDLIMNTLGALAGFGIYCGWRKGRRKVHVFW